MVHMCKPGLLWHALLALLDLIVIGFLSRSARLIRGMGSVGCQTVLWQAGNMTLMCGAIRWASAAGWLGLQQPRSSVATAAAAGAEATSAAKEECSQGLLEVLSALGGRPTSPVAAGEAQEAVAALPQHEWKEQGKLVQQLVLVLLQILTIHHEVSNTSL